MRTFNRIIVYGLIVALVSGLFYCYHVIHFYEYRDQRIHDLSVERDAMYPITPDKQPRYDELTKELVALTPPTTMP